MLGANAAVGTYTATATIGSDTNYNAATSGAVTITIANANPTISLISSPISTTTVGTPLTYTAIVTGLSNIGAPSGSLTFNVSGTAGATSCTSTTAGAVVGLTTTYTCAIQTPVSGTYIVSATYNGDSNYLALTATAPTTITIAKLTPTITLAEVGTATFNTTLTFTATVVGSLGIAPSNALSNITWHIGGTAGVGSCTPTTGVKSGATTTFTCTI